MVLHLLDYYLDKPIDLIEKLDDNGKRHFFLALDYMSDHLLRGEGFPPADKLSQLTNKTDIIDYVQKMLQAQLATASSIDEIWQTVAMLQRWKPSFMAVAAAPSIGLDLTSGTRQPVKNTDAPLGGTALGDGQIIAWDERLKRKSKAYNNHASANGKPLLENRFEALQAQAELASLEFRVNCNSNGSGSGGARTTAAKAATAAAAAGVAGLDDTGAAFPTWPADQQKLVAKAYDAIMNMDNILEKRRPQSLKRPASSDPDEIDSSEPTLTPSSTHSLTPKRKREGSGGDGGDAPRPAKATRENISVTKVKSLSRIEVEILSWNILFKVKELHEGRLPFYRWGGKDWGWDGSFPSFGARFDAVTETLRRSKAAVCSLLESDYLARLAAHPVREYRRKENNRAQNAERNAQVLVGRHAIGSGQVAVHSDGALKDRDGNIVAPACANYCDVIEQTRKLAENTVQRGSAKRPKRAAGADVSTAGELAAAGGASRKPRSSKTVAAAAAAAAAADAAAAAQMKTEAAAVTTPERPAQAVFAFTTPSGGGTSSSPNTLASGTLSFPGDWAAAVAVASPSLPASSSSSSSSQPSASSPPGEAQTALHFLAEQQEQLQQLQQLQLQPELFGSALGQSLTAFEQDWPFFAQDPPPPHADSTPTMAADFAFNSALMNSGLAVNDTFSFDSYLAGGSTAADLAGSSNSNSSNNNEEGVVYTAAAGSGNNGTVGSDDSQGAGAPEDDFMMIGNLDDFLPLGTLDAAAENLFPGF